MLTNYYRRRQIIGLFSGAILGVVVISFLLTPFGEKYHIKGPMNTGHENFACQSCHKLARGTVRQQLQANLKYVLGRRESPVDFGHYDVDNTICLSCHERPYDRHPVFRFQEIRFEEARKGIGAHECVSCHTEHQGKRVTVRPDYCFYCHSDLSLKSDPLDVPHKELVKLSAWTTCLKCHDFHGNHEIILKTKLADTLSTSTIINYFNGGLSPYSKIVKYKAKKKG